MRRIGFEFGETRFEGVGEFSHSQLVINDITGRDPLASEYTTGSTTAVDGVRLLGRNLPVRTIEVEMTIRARFPVDLRQTMRELGEKLYSTDPLQLIFDDQEGHYLAVADWQESEASPTLVKGTAVFTCHDPFLYGEQVTASPSAGTLGVDTNYIVEPVWTIQTTGSTSSGFSVEVNGRTWSYEDAIASGQTITIDVERMETRVNGELRALEVYGTYPVLEAHNEVAVSVNSNVSVSYQQRWI